MRSQRKESAELNINCPEINGRVNEDFLLRGEWLTLRFTVEGEIGIVIYKVWLNGKKIMEAGSEQPGRRDLFEVVSGGTNDAWEIDYIRWKNKILDISVPLEKSLDDKEKLAVENEAARKKLEALLE